MEGRQTRSCILGLANNITVFLQRICLYKGAKRTVGNHKLLKRSNACKPKLVLPIVKISLENLLFRTWCIWEKGLEQIFSLVNSTKFFVCYPQRGFPECLNPHEQNPIRYTCSPISEHSFRARLSSQVQRWALPHSWHAKQEKQYLDRGKNKGMQLNMKT